MRIRSIADDCVLPARATGPNLVEFLKRLFVSRISEEAMSGFATTLTPRAIRSIVIAGAVLALFGSVAAPARASDFYGPDRYDYGSPRYDYDAYRYHHRCSWCGCWGRCQSNARPSGVFERSYRYVERKYVEREYVERRYTWRVHRHHRYGCCYAPWRSSYYPGYRASSTPYPWGYGGIRGQQPSYGYGRSGYYDAPRPPAPVGDDAGPYGDEGRRWDPE